MSKSEQAPRGAPRQSKYDITLLGGFASALFARRVQATVERGPGVSSRARLIFALTGGLLAGAIALFLARRQRARSLPPISSS